MRTRAATDLSKGDLTAKDMEQARERDSAYVEANARHGVIQDLSLQHRVEMDWDLNAEAKRDRIFKLRIDDYEVLLDAEMVLRMLRWV